MSEEEDRALRQRRDALEIATGVRVGQRQLKDDLRDGYITFKAALVDPRAGKLTLQQLIRAMPNWGIHRANVVAREARVSPERYVVDISEHEREELVFAVRYRDRNSRAVAVRR